MKTNNMSRAKQEILIHNLYQELKNNESNIECEDNLCDDAECRLFKALTQYLGDEEFNDANAIPINFDGYDLKCNDKINLMINEKQRQETMQLLFDNGWDCDYRGPVFNNTELVFYKHFHSISSANTELDRLGLINTIEFNNSTLRLNAEIRLKNKNK